VPTNDATPAGLPPPLILFDIFAQNGQKRLVVSKCLLRHCTASRRPPLQLGDCLLGELGFVGRIDVALHFSERLVAGDAYDFFRSKDRNKICSALLVRTK